jgi:DNA-binding response OmpR family regulator
LLDGIAVLSTDGESRPLVDQDEMFLRTSGRKVQRVLVVDDERLIADTVAAILNANGFEALEAYNGEEALDAARKFQPDIVLSDVLMPRMSGVELGIKIRLEFPCTRIFLFSGQAATSELMRKARDDGHTFELFFKPIHPEELIAKLRGL